MFFMALYDDSVCTCAEREHACSPPCRKHPERGGGLGNPATAVPEPWDHVTPFISEEEAPTDGGSSNDPYPAGRGA